MVHEKHRRLSPLRIVDDIQCPVGLGKTKVAGKVGAQGLEKKYAVDSGMGDKNGIVSVPLPFRVERSESV